jgi:hypothetical protein
VMAHTLCSGLAGFWRSTHSPRCGYCERQTKAAGARRHEGMTSRRAGWIRITRDRRRTLGSMDPCSRQASQIRCAAQARAGFRHSLAHPATPIAKQDARACIKQNQKPTRPPAHFLGQRAFQPYSIISPTSFKVRPDVPGRVHAFNDHPPPVDLFRAMCTPPWRDAGSAVEAVRLAHTRRHAAALHDARMDGG